MIFCLLFEKICIKLLKMYCIWCLGFPETCADWGRWDREGAGWDLHVLSVLSHQEGVHRAQREEGRLRTGRYKSLTYQKALFVVLEIMCGLQQIFHRNKEKITDVSRAMVQVITCIHIYVEVIDSVFVIFTATFKLPARYRVTLKCFTMDSMLTACRMLRWHGRLDIIGCFYPGLEETMDG